jgi:hypothetical protein
MVWMDGWMDGVDDGWMMDGWMDDGGWWSQLWDLKKPLDHPLCFRFSTKGALLLIVIGLFRPNWEMIY